MDVWGNPEGMDVHGNLEHDIWGNPQGADVFGNPPHDVLGNYSGHWNSPEQSPDGGQPDFWSSFFGLH